MLGDLMGMMGKLKDTKKRVEATRARLDTISMKEVGGEGGLEVTLTANREIKEIHISEALMKNREALEDYLTITLNRALKKAGDVHDAELSAAAREGMPDIPGMEQFLK